MIKNDKIKIKLPQKEEIKSPSELVKSKELKPGENILFSQKKREHNEILPYSLRRFYLDL